MDDDGISVGQRVPIHVRVTVDDHDGRFDSIVAAGAGLLQFRRHRRTLVLPGGVQVSDVPLELPINDGAFRALAIVLPPGRVVSAVKPAAMRMWMCYPMTIVDTIFKALAPALPNQVIAGHHADLVVGRINGRRPKDNSFYIYLGGLIGGGWGAKYDSDGPNATIAMNDGDTHTGPSEQVEAKFPLLVERYCLRPDSGGAGRFRGGLGTEQVVQARHPIRFSSQMDRVKCKPWGLNGGMSGFGNGVAASLRQDRRAAFRERQGAEPGAAGGRRLHSAFGGGGGYGSPLERSRRAGARRAVRLRHAAGGRRITARCSGQHAHDRRGSDAKAPRADARAKAAARPPDRRNGSRVCRRAASRTQSRARRSQSEERVAFAMQCRFSL